MIDPDTNDVLKSIRRDIKDLFRQLGKQATRMPVGGGGGGNLMIYTADVYANLPTDVGTPSLGFTTGNQQFYIFREHIENPSATTWVAVGSFSPLATPASIGEENGDIWYGRGATPTDEQLYEGVLLVKDSTQEDGWRPCSTFAPTTGLGVDQRKPVGTMGYNAATDVGYMMCLDSDDEHAWFPITHLVDPISAE